MWICGLVLSNQFGEVFVCNDGGKCHDVCGVYIPYNYLNIESTSPKTKCQEYSSMADVCIVDFGDVDYDLFVESVKHFRSYYESDRDKLFDIYFDFITNKAV